MSEPDIHVDWHMTPDEWDELRGILLRNTGYEYIGKLEAAGALSTALAHPHRKPQPAPGLTPGQAARGAFLAMSGDPAKTWGELDDALRARWEAIAQAAIATQQPAPEAAAELDQLRQELAVTIAWLHAEADATAPSKKSEIQRAVAKRLGEIGGRA